MRGRSVMTILLTAATMLLLGECQGAPATTVVSHLRPSEGARPQSRALQDDGDEDPIPMLDSSTEMSEVPGAEDASHEVKSEVDEGEDDAEGSIDDEEETEENEDGKEDGESSSEDNTKETEDSNSEDVSEEAEKLGSTGESVKEGNEDTSPSEDASSEEASQLLDAVESEASSSEDTSEEAEPVTEDGVTVDDHEGIPNANPLEGLDDAGDEINGQGSDESALDNTNEIDGMESPLEEKSPGDGDTVGDEGIGEGDDNEDTGDDSSNGALGLGDDSNGGSDSTASPTVAPTKSESASKATEAPSVISDRENVFDKGEVESAGWFGGIFALSAMIFTAWQMSDNPDGIYAATCRLIITILGLFCRIVTTPCRLYCGGGQNQRYGGHMPVSTMDYGYKDPSLELA